MRKSESGMLRGLVARPCLGAQLGGRDNHFNLLRIIAAYAVMVSHAFAITTGREALEPLRIATGHSLGEYAVAVFFGISGLLIARSFDRRASFAHFLTARILRLFPALLVVLALSAFVLGPVVSAFDARSYFLASGTWSYVPRNLFLVFRIDTLPGVFVDNPRPLLVNSPLWSLFYEVFCYGMVVLVGYCGLLRYKPAFALFLLLAVAGHLLSVFFQPAEGLAYRLDVLGFAGFPFALGMAAYVWRDHLPLGAVPAALLWLFVLVAASTPLLASAIMVATVYTALWMALVPKGPLLRYNALGDFSYGFYIFAWPIQQTLAYYAMTTTPLANVVVTTPLMLAFSYASWHLIEEPSLNHARQMGDQLWAAWNRCFGMKQPVP